MSALDEPLTEKRVAGLLMRDRYQKHVCLANYTPAGWWENDLIQITASGYWHEFEVKLTLADFRRDPTKWRECGAYVYGQDREIEFKHHLLAGDPERGPCCFWYVAPAGVIPVAELPSWAGLIEIEQSGKNIYERRPTVKAPRRHGNKADPAIRLHVFETCYWRYHHGRT